MSDTAYGWTYLGLNAASALGTIGGRLGMKHAGTTNYRSAKMTAETPYAKNVYGSNIYYYDGKGNPYYSVHNVGATNQHWHTSLGRDGDHIGSYLELVWKLIIKSFGG